MTRTKMRWEGEFDKEAGILTLTFIDGSQYSFRMNSFIEAHTLHSHIHDSETRAEQNARKQIQQNFNTMMDYL